MDFRLLHDQIFGRFSGIPLVLICLPIGFNPMNEFVAYIVKNLVDSPDLVDVKSFESDNTIIVEIRVGQTDIGKVVGRKGMTIKALRTVAMMVCARLGRRVRVELVESKEGISS